MLDIVSTNKGIIIPRTTEASITNPVIGMMIYDTEAKTIKTYNKGSGTDPDYWSIVGENDPEVVGLNPNYPKSRTILRANDGMASCKSTPKLDATNKPIVKYNGINVPIEEVSFVSIDLSIASVDSNGVVTLVDTSSGKNALIAVTYNGFSTLVAFPITTRGKLFDDINATVNFKPDLSKSRLGVTGSTIEMFGGGGSGSKYSNNAKGGGSGGYLKYKFNFTENEIKSTNTSFNIKIGNGGDYVPANNDPKPGNDGLPSIVSLQDIENGTPELLFTLTAAGGGRGISGSASDQADANGLIRGDLTYPSTFINNIRGGVATGANGDNADNGNIPTNLTAGTGGENGYGHSGTFCVGGRYADAGSNYGAGGGAVDIRDCTILGGYGNSATVRTGAGAKGAVRIKFDCPEGTYETVPSTL
jgi:hypothetical protein